MDTSRTVEEMRAAGVYLVTTADDLVDRCRAGLRLVSETVLPAVRGSAAAG